MSDKKTIQEALAEVQRNAELMKVQEAKAAWGEALQIDEGLFNTVLGLSSKGRKAAKATEKVKPMPSTRADFGLSPEAPKSSKTIEGKAEAPKAAETPKAEAPKSNVPATIEEPKGSKLGAVGKTALGLGALGALGFGGAYLYNKATGGSSDDQKAADGASKAGETPTPKPVTTTKDSTKSQAQTFGQAFAAARKAAGERGTQSTGQFEYKGKKYQTNVQGTGTAEKPQEKYVSLGKQTPVTGGTMKTPPTPPSRPAETKSSETPKTSAPPLASVPSITEPAKADSSSLQPSSIAPPQTFKKQPGLSTQFSTESGKRKMSEEYIEEVELPTGAKVTRATGDERLYTQYKRGGEASRSFQDAYRSAKPGSTFKWKDPSGVERSYKAGPGSGKPMGTGPKPQQNNLVGPKPQQNNLVGPKPSSSGQWADPGKLDYSKSNMNPTLSSTGGIERGGPRDPVPSDVRRDTVNGKPGGETGMYSDGGRTVSLQGKSVSVPTTDRSPSVTSSNPTPNTENPKVGSSGGSSSFLNPNPTADAGKFTKTNLESGGKKKVSESTGNSLIDMFLRLQEKNTINPNIFEAAKRAKRDYDDDGRIESEKDEVWGSRFRAARRAGKMDEEQIDELKKPTPETALKVVNRATDRDEWTPKAANRLYDRYKKGYEPKEKKTEVKEGMLDPKDPSVQGGKAVSVREAESFLQRFNPFNQLAKSIPTSTEPKKPEQDMRIIVNTPPKKQPPKDGSSNSPFPANEEVEQVDEKMLDNAKAYARLGSKGMARTDAIASKLSDRTGNWDFKKSGFTGAGKEQVKSRLKNVKGASDYALRNDDVQFSEEEIAYFNAVMEAEPVNKRDVRDSDQTGIRSSSAGGNITDETIFEGRPRKNPIASDEESPTMNVAAQVRTTRAKTNDGGKTWHVPLKHPITGKTHHVPQKAVDDFNKAYASASKKEDKESIESAFKAKHMGD